jgi:microtubule-associated protein-like 1/2
MCKGTLDIHDKGMICSIRWFDGNLISGGKDQKIKIYNEEGSVTKEINMGCLIRALDVKEGNILCGLRNGTICHIDSSDNQTKLMESHSEGELWGLAIAGGTSFVSSADDNQIKEWDYSQRKCISTGIISNESRKAPKGGASSLSEYPDSKCARGVAYHAEKGHVGVCHNDGTVTVRNSNKLDEPMHTLRDAEEWSECIEFSPCGSLLAIGSHDNIIYVYETDGYTLKHKLKAHTSYICGMDWSQCSSYIRSVCGGYELLFFKLEDGEQDKSKFHLTIRWGF